MTKEELLQTIAEGESQQVELKSSFNVEAMESVAAFANAEGGKVFIGVSNKGKIVGVKLNAESIQNWVNEIKSKTEPALLVDAAQFELEGKTIVVLSVSEYPIKPIAMQGRYFKRVQNSNHLLSATEIANLSMLSLQVSWDSFPALGKTMDDLDKEAVERFVGKVNAGGRLNLNGYGTGYTRVRNEIAAYPTMKFNFEEKPSAWLVTISYEDQKTDEKGELATNLSQLVPNLSVQVKTLIISLKDGEKSATELLLVPELVQAYSNKSPVYFKKQVIYPAIKQGLVAMLYPDKPKHPKQKYYLTEKGREVLKALK